MSSFRPTRRQMATLLGAGPVLAWAAEAEASEARDGLARGTPESQGVAPDAILAWLDDLQRSGVEMNSFMLYRNGRVISEGWWKPYAPRRLHMMHSATKSFLSAGIGMAVAEGRFALTDKVVSFFPENLPPAVSDNLAAMTVEDLLTQTCGHERSISGSVWRNIPTSWVTEFFKAPVAFRPGEKFTYSSATSFMLSAILSKTTGKSAHAYLKPRLFVPLGIRDERWDVGPEGINPGGNGLTCRTADLLKLAKLHLDQGRWNGRQLLQPAWVQAATTSQRGNPYGYHWWTIPGSSAYFAYGAFGQFAYVYPEHQAIVAMTSACPWLEPELRAVVARNFPKMFEAGSSSAGAAALRDRTARLELLEPLAMTSSPRVREISGRTFVAEPNEDGVRSLRLTFSGGECLFEMQDEKGAHRVRIGLRDWIEGATTVSGAKLHHGYEPDSLKVVAGGRWLADDHFETRWQFVESSFRDTVDLRFDGATVKLDRRVNVNSGPTQRPTIVARLA